MSMFGSGFKTSKLKAQLKMAVHRFQISSNKKSALMKQQMREIAKLLCEDTPKEEKARIRAESLIREDNTIEAYEILQLECELLAERIKLIQVEKQCPQDLVSCVSTLMWATDRCDIPELVEIRKQFRSKYGKKFEEDAMKNVGGRLNERVVAKLSVQPPSAYLVQTYLEKICEEHEVAWEPKVRLTAEDAVEPMAAPVGYSVPMGAGTGLGTVVTGTPNADQEIRFVPPPKGDDGDGGDVPPPYHPSPYAPVVGVPYVQPVPPPAPTNTDFEEPDIFIPSAPGASNGTGKNRKDDDDDDGAGGAGDNGASYDDLAKRFSALKK